MAETPDTPKQEIKLFYCYAREDKALRDELQVNLSGLRRQYQLTNWHDREILPGEQWEEAIDKHLSTADVILLLISPHFVDSDYCYGKEMQHALQQHHAGNCCVIPILLRPTYWEDTPLGTIQMLPTDARPITSWPDRYEAFHDVARGISTAIKALLIVRSRKTKQDWLLEGQVLGNLKQFEEALTAFERAIRLDPNYATAYYCKGNALYYKGLTLYDPRSHEEALIAYEQALRLAPNYAFAYNGKGNALYNLKRFEEALIAYEQALRLAPNYAFAYNGKGAALRNLKRFEEALIAYEQAIRLEPSNKDHYSGKGAALRDLKRYEQALTAYDQAIQLDPNFTSAYHNKGLSLQALGRGEEAQQAFDTARQLGYNG